jgi:hypothetical protein
MSKACSQETAVNSPFLSNLPSLHAQQRCRQAILAVLDLRQEVALDAVQPLVDRRIGVALGGHDAAVPGTHQHAAARAAVSGRRPCPNPATAMTKRIAPRGQASPQARQMTPVRPMHIPETCGRPAQDASAARLRAPRSQASTQSPQNVHSPRAKSTRALPSTTPSTPSWQTGTHSPQPSQARVNAEPVSAAGGAAIAAGRLLLKKSRRDSADAFPLVMRLCLPAPWRARLDRSHCVGMR